MNLKSNLEQILLNTLSFQATEAAFLGLVLHEENEESEVKKRFIDSFKGLWSTLTTQQQCDEVINFFVNFVNNQTSRARIIHLHEFLICVVEKGFVNARKVCEAVLASPGLQFINATVWQQSFTFVSQLLQQMDYKSVRAVFSVLLHKVKAELPISIMESQLHLLDEMKKVIQLGIDRNRCLLPSYFVINEISKLYPDSEFHPHWAVGKQFTDFVNSFKPLAMMVSISGQFALYPVVGYSGTTNVWNLEPSSLKFLLKGPLPYQKPYTTPQKSLLRFVIAHQYSREIVCSMLGLKKQQNQRCEALEELLVDLLILAMEKTEMNSEGDESHQLLWQHLSSQFIFFILFQFASFPHMVLALHSRLKQKYLQKGRNQLMWVLLQFISGSIQRGPLSSFAPVMKLFDLLYPEKEPLPVNLPISTDANDSFAMTCIWIHLSKKAENVPLQNSPPPQLSKQLEYLHQSLQQKQHDGSGYEITVLCNAYSTTPDSFQTCLQELVGRCYGPIQNSVKLPGGPKGCTATGNAVPLEVRLLDSLTVHSKMSLIQGIVARIGQVALAIGQQQQQIVLAPGLVETYSRLLVYMEIELLGIKGFIGELPKILQNKAWGILHALLEMFSYRLHHIQPHYRVNLLTHLHNIATVPFTDRSQLHLCIQHTALRLIMGFGNVDIQMQLSLPKFTSDPKQILSKDCEELNLVLILSLARAIHITRGDQSGLNWSEGILKEAMIVTPHRWSAYTLEHFPITFQNFYNENVTIDDTSVKALIEKVEQHYRNIKGLSTDEEIVNYCTDSNQKVPEIFLCVVWKILLEKGVVTPVCYQILMKLRTKALLNHLNMFTDYMVSEVIHITARGSQSSQQALIHLNDLMWKYHVIPIDRLVLSLCLRPHKDRNMQIYNFKIIKYLLTQTNELKTRVKSFVSENSPQHWLQEDWLKHHVAYHEKFPEHHYFEGILEANNLPMQSPEYLPTYFGNVCLRFLPVLDILLHRLLELPSQQGGDLVETVLNDYGALFKFHDKPITYLYNTLHYFNNKLNDNIPLKRKLAAAIVSSQKDIYPENWVCSKECLNYLLHGDEQWQLSISYFQKLLDKFVTSLSEKQIHNFSTCDWRFNEFPNSSAHCLYVTCVELMALPMKTSQVASILVSIICKEDNTAANIKVRKDVMGYINAVALILVSLPSSCAQVLNQKIIDIIQNKLSLINVSTCSTLPSFFDFYSNYSMNCADYQDYMLALFHATWLHSSQGQFTQLTRFLKEDLKAFITNECQLLFTLCLFGPFLQRLHHERTRKRDSLFEISREFYLIIEQVCRNTSYLVYVDLISDFLYHLKYMYVGDNLREVIEKTMPHFHVNLQNRLKFMATPVAPVVSDEESRLVKQHFEKTHNISDKKQMKGAIS